MTKPLSIFNAQKSTSFRILCCALEGSINIQNPNEAWKDRIGWITTSPSYRDCDGINGEPTEFEWNISQNEGNERECLANAKVVSMLAKKFGIGLWSYIGPGSEKKWYSMEENSPQGIGDHIAEKMLLEFAESGCPIFRATTPMSKRELDSKGHGKLSIHFAADQETIETIFRIIVFASLLSLYGAISNMCEECESLHDRSGQPDVVMGQSIVLSEIKAEVLLENDNPTYQNVLLQRCEGRI